MSDDQLSIRRRRFPRGTRVRGTVTGFPGRAGASPPAVDSDAELSQGAG